MALPGLQYLVAFNNNANDDPGLITSIASPPGTLGAVNVWTDISRYVTDDTGDRGRSHELQAMEAGTRQLTLRNDDGRFTPWNTAGPYTGLLNPRKPVQVRANWASSNYPRFTGQVDSWATNWPDARTQLAILHVTDAFRMLNLADITSGGYPAQVIADGAIAYWRLGDVIGSPRAVDSAGTHPGVPDASVTFGQSGALIANPGTSAQIDQTTAAGVFGGISIPSVFGSKTAVTVVAWYNSSVAVGDLSILFTVTMVAAALPLQFSFNVNNPLGLQIVTGGGSSFNQTATVSDGNWHQVAVTVTSGASLSQLVSIALYLDGILIGSNGALASGSGGNPFTGSDLIGSQNGPSAAFNVQEVAFFPTALSGATIANEYNLATFPQERTDLRIRRVLNAISWSTGARALDPGSATMQKVTSSVATTSSLSHLQSVEATEGGALYMSTDGQVTFKSRQTLLGGANYTIPQAVFGDNTAAGDIPFLPAPDLARDDIDLYNEAAAQRTGGNMQVTDNNTSIAAYGRVTWSPPATLAGISDADVLSLTQYIVQKFSTPVDRLAAITVDLASVANTFPSVVGSLLLLDLLQLITVERTIMPGNATTFSQVGVIEHISETISGTGTWTITFGLAVADPSWWILGTDQLGTGTLLAY